MPVTLLTVSSRVSVKLNAAPPTAETTGLTAPPKPELVDVELLEPQNEEVIDELVM